MKILLVSVTAGHGHHATADAIECSLQRRGHEVLKTDIFQQISSALYQAVDKGYLLSTKYTPSQYGRLYRNMEKNDLLRRSMLGILQSELLSDRFYEQVDRFRPDAIVCTHVAASQIIDDLFEQNATRALHVGIVTDYTMHPFWETVRNIDYIVLASDLLKYRAVARGISPDKLIGLGIPVHPKYTTKMSREEACGLLNIDPARHTVLFMAGSMGFGNMIPAVEGFTGLDLPVQALCVCGRNKKMADKLRRYPFEAPVRVYGFVDNVDVMMDACDCIVTKPGGLSVTEALAKRKPLILQTPIPGQEEENADFLLNYGLALRATETVPVEELLHTMFHNPTLSDGMYAAIDNFIKPNAAETLCDLIEEKGK